MKNIVQVKDDNLLVSIVDIKKFSGVSEKAIISTIRKNAESFSRFGNIKLALNVSHMHRLLNEAETTFLLTLLKNTKEVVKFKSDLVFQFYSMKSQICDNNKKQLQMKDNQLKISQEQTKKANSRKYANSGDDVFCNIHKFRVDNNLNVSDEEFNNILVDENILGLKLVNRYVPCPTGEYSKYDGSSIVVNINKMIQICKNRNIKQFEEIPNLFNI